MKLRKRKMIKWIKSLIEKIFGKKEKPIILEDEEKYLEDEAKMAQYLEDKIIEPEKIQCNTHSRFKKSCPMCVEAAK
jgi:hypothetical protein